MRWVLEYSHGILPEVEWVVVVAGHVEPVAAIAGPTEAVIASKILLLVECICVSYNLRLRCRWRALA